MGILLFCGMRPNPLSHTGQGCPALFTKTKTNKQNHHHSVLRTCSLHFSVWWIPFNFPEPFNHPCTVESCLNTPIPHPYSVRADIPAPTHTEPTNLLSFLERRISVSTPIVQNFQKQGQQYVGSPSKCRLNE